METQERKLRTNLDTDLLKLVAIAAMLLDHIGGAFFPETPIFRWYTLSLYATSGGSAGWPSPCSATV